MGDNLDILFQNANSSDNNLRQNAMVKLNQLSIDSSFLEISYNYLVDNKYPVNRRLLFAVWIKNYVSLYLVRLFFNIFLKKF